MSLELFLHLLALFQINSNYEVEDVQGKELIGYLLKKRGRLERVLGQCGIVVKVDSLCKSIVQELENRGVICDHRSIKNIYCRSRA